MSTIIKAKLDLPPSTNHIYGRRKGGGTFLKDDGRYWRDTATATLSKCPHFDQIAVIVRFYFSNLRRRDTDNMMKLLMDAIVDAKIVRDDNWTIVKSITIEGYLNKENPHLELLIKGLN